MLSFDIAAKLARNAVKAITQNTADWARGERIFLHSQIAASEQWQQDSKAALDRRAKANRPW